MARFTVGDVVTVTNQFSVNQTATAPGTVTLSVTAPSGSVTAYTDATITTPTTGLYSQTVVTTESGMWRYVWTGTDPAADVAPGTFNVFEVSDTSGYCTLDQAKDALQLLGSSDVKDDESIQRAILTASRLIDLYCGRRFYPDAADSVRYFTPRHFQTLRLGGDPTSTGLISVTSVAADRTGNGTYSETYTEATDFALTPRNASAAGRPYVSLTLLQGALAWPQGIETVRVTGKFGWPTGPPPEIVEAALIQTTRIWKRVREAPFGIASIGLDGGGMRLLSKLDADVQLLVDPYRLPMVA
jgi:hypothetical protein